MTSFVRLQSDATWIAGYTPNRADLEDWDRKVAGMVNGDDGGCWAPSSPIVLSNAGAGDGQLVISGLVKVCYGGRLTTLSGARYLLPPGQFEGLAEGHAGRVRALPTSFLDATVEPSAAGSPVPLAMGLRVTGARWRVDLAPGPDSPGNVETVGPFDEAPTRTSVELEVHDGATLASVTITWIAGHGTPRARLVRFDLNGNPTPITLTPAGADAGGWTKLAAADPALGIQSATVVCDAGVVVDRSANSYWLQIEEDQTLKDNVYLLKKPARLASTVNLDDLHGAPVIDGMQTVPGDIILLRAQTDPRQNGLWYVYNNSGTHLFPVGVTSTSGAFVYSTSSGVFPSGYVVPILDGVTQRGTVWQMTNKAGGPTGPFNPANSDVFEVLTVDGHVIASYAQQFEPFPTSGNTYLSATAHLTNITDTRWQ